MQERAFEPHNYYTKKADESHMLKLAMIFHFQSDPPTFNQYIVGSYKTSLYRQIAEAVLTRLVVDREWDKTV